MDNQLGSAAEGTMNKSSGETSNNPIFRVEGLLANPINITENADSIITLTMDRVEETLKAFQKLGKIPSSPALGPLTVSRPFVAAPFIMLNLDRISSPLSDLDSTQGDNSPNSRGYSFRVLSVGDVQLTPDAALATGRSLTDLRTPLEDNSLPSIEFGNFGSGLNPGEIQICNLEAPIKVFTEQKVQRNTVGELQLVERIEVVGDGVSRGSGDFVKLVPAIDNVGIEPVPVLSTRHEVFLGAGQILIERTTRLIQNPRRGGYRQNAAGHIEYYTFKSDLQDVSNRVGGVAPRVETIPDSKYGLIGPLKITTRREMQRLHDGDYRTKDIITIEIIRNSNEPTTTPDANVDAVEIPFKDRDYTESDGNGTKKVSETVKFGDGSLIITRVLEIAAFNGYNVSFEKLILSKFEQIAIRAKNSSGRKPVKDKISKSHSCLQSAPYQSYRIAIPRVWCVRESLPTIRGSMATPPPPASQQPGTVADGVAQTHHGIDAALQAILNNKANAHNIDVVAVANHLTVQAIDSIETTLKAYRNFGRPISIQGPSAKPLTVTSPYARRVEIARSPFSTRTARGTPRSNVSSTRTAQEISPGSTARSQFSPRTARAISPEPLTAMDRSPGAIGSFTSLDTRQYQTAVEPSLRSDPNVSTARPMLTGDDTSAQGSAATTTPSSLRTARRLSPLAGSSTSDQPRKLTPAEQWANVKPGPGPRIVPASAKKSVSNTSVHTAREKKPAAASSGSRLVPNKSQTSKQLWDDLVEAAKAAGAPIEAKSPGLAPPPSRDESPVNTCRPLEETISETNIHTAITRSPVPSYQPVGNLEASGTTSPVRGAPNAITGRGLSAREPSQNHTARATSPLRGATVTGRGLSAREQPSTAQALTSPVGRGGTDAQTGRGLSAREALARTPKKVSSNTHTGREASKRASRVSIDRTNKSDSTRTGLEASSRAGIDALNRSGREPVDQKPSFHAGLEGSNRSGRDSSARGGLKQPANVLFEKSDKSGRDASTRTGLEASNRSGRGSSTLVDKSSDYAGLDAPAGSGGAASTRTGLEASSRNASNRSGREHFNRTGRHFPHVVDSSTQTVHTGLEASTKTGKSARSPHPSKSATRTPTAKEPSTSTARLVPKSPARDSSKSNVHSSGYPTAISAGPNTRNLRTAQGTQTDPTVNDKSVSTRTGKDLSAPKKKKKRSAKGEERSRRRQQIEAGQQPSESTTGSTSLSESGPRKLRSSSSQTSQKSSGFPTAREQTSPVVRTAVENPIKQGLAPPSHLGLPSPPSSTLVSSRDVNQNPSQLRPNESFHTAKSGSWHTLPTTESPAPRSKNSNAIRTGRSPAPNSISNAIPGGAPQSPGVATAYSPGPRTAIGARSPAPQSISNARAGNAYPQSPGFGSNAQAGSAYPPASPGVATAYSPGPRTAVLARSPAPQSISNARARTASERSTGYPAADGTGAPQDNFNARSGDIKVARSPGTAKAFSPSTRTGVQALTPKASASALQKSSRSAVPKSSGTRTGIQAQSPGPKSGRSGLPQDQQADASTRTGRSLSERSSGYPTAVSPGFPIDDGLQAIRTGRSPAPQTISNARPGDVNVARSPGTAKPYSPSSSNAQPGDAGLARSPSSSKAFSSSTRTGVQALTPKSSASAVPKSSASALKSPSTRTGVQALSPKPSMSALGLKSSRSLAPKSSGTRTGVLALSPAPGSGRSGLPQDQFADASTLRTGRLLSEQSSDYPSVDGLQPSALPQDAQPADPSTRTGRLPSEQSSGYPTAAGLQPSGAPQDGSIAQPGDAALARSPSSSKAYSSSTRTGVQALTPKSSASAVPKSSASALNSPSTRTGVAALSPKPSMSALGLKSSRSAAPKSSGTRTGVLALSPKPSNSAVPVSSRSALKSPSTRTGIVALSPAPKSGSSALPQDQFADASTRTGRLLSEQSSGFPAADGLQPSGAQQDDVNAQPRDAAVSQSASTRTGVLARSPAPKSNQLLQPKLEPADSSLTGSADQSSEYPSANGQSSVPAGAQQDGANAQPGDAVVDRSPSSSKAFSSSTRTGVQALTPKSSASVVPKSSSSALKSPSTRTGVAALSPKPSMSALGLKSSRSLAPKSSGTRTAVLARSPAPGSDGFGLVQNQQDDGYQTAYSDRDLARQILPQRRPQDSQPRDSDDAQSSTTRSPAYLLVEPTVHRAAASVRTGRSLSHRSPNADGLQQPGQSQDGQPGYDAGASRSPSTRTGVQALTPKSSASAVPKSSASALKSPSTRTGVQALSPKPSVSALGLKSSRSAVPKTSGTRTGVLAQSPAPGSGRSGLPQDQFADASTRTGRLPSEQSSGFPNADGLSGQSLDAPSRDAADARSSSTRTGVLARSPASKSNQLLQPKVEPADSSSISSSLSEQSSEYPAAHGQSVPAGAQQDGSNAQPGDAAVDRSPSSSKAYSSSTRTGVQALTPKSSASAVPKTSSSALKSPSTRTGVQALSPKPSMSALGLKSSRSLAPKSSGTRTGVAALSPKPSVSAVAKSSQSALPADASTRTGRSISQMSSGYPTAHSPGPDTLKSLNVARSPISDIRAGLAPSAYHALAIPDSTPPDSPVTTAQLLGGARTGLQARSPADKSSSSALPQNSPSTRTGVAASKSSASMLPKSSRSMLPPASPGVATAHSPGPRTAYSARSPAPQSISNARAGNAYPPASPGVATAYSPGPRTALQARSPAPQSISNARAGSAYPPASPGVATAYSPGPRTAIQARSPAPQSISNARPGNVRTPTQVSSGYPTARSPGFDVKECFDAIKNARSPARQAAAANARGSYGQSPVKTGNEPSERSTRTANRPGGAASAISGHRLSPNLNLDPSQSLFGHSAPRAGSTPSEGIIAGDVGQVAPRAGSTPSEADVASAQGFQQPQQPGRRRRSGGRAPRSARTVSPNVFTAVSPGGSQRSSGLPTALSPGYSSGADMKTEELFPILDPAAVPARNLLPVETPPGQSPPKSPYVGALPVDSSRAPADTYAPANIGRLAPSPGMTTGVSPLVASTNSPVQIALNPMTGMPAPGPAPQPDGHDDGVDTVSVESSDEGETIASALSVTIDNTHIDPATGRRRRRMRPKRIVLNGEEVWKKPQ
uniref:DUF4819 domain-containing protein n=1 Tax=Panagrellus redivivus TaxID=6233 RepID=A0A7E4VGN5_PANRE